MNVVAYSPDSAVEALEGALAPLGLGLDRVLSVGALFAALSEPRAATIVSLTSGEVDEAMLERIAGEPNAGHLVLTRDGLPARTRELLACAGLLALDQPRQLLAHLRGARRTGATREELEELLELLAPDAPAGAAERARALLPRTEEPA